MKVSSPVVTCQYTGDIYGGSYNLIKQKYTYKCDVCGTIYDIDEINLLYAVNQKNSYMLFGLHEHRYKLNEY